MPRLEGLQFARAIAVLMVLTGHVIAEAEHYFAIDLPGDAIPWTRGVDLFFVISGFIVIRAADRWQAGAGAFLARRFLRIAPLYYLFTTLMVLTLLAAPGAVKDTALAPGQIVGSYPFWPTERYDGRIAPVLSVGWTLNYEMAFYAALSLCLTLRRPVLAMGLLFGALALLGALSGPEGPFPSTTSSQIKTIWAFATNPICLEFLFGMVLARLWPRRRVSARIAWGLGIGGAVLLVALDATDLPRFLAAGVPAAMIVGAVIWPAPWQGWPLQRIGDASFAIYLSHRFTLRALTLVLLPLLPAAPWAAPLFCVLAVALAAGVGWLVFTLVERPVAALVSASPRSQPVPQR
ncbi:Peptidoglycan/LPS O-acetylase OafA/YrhL, contains acyltransferase and SGNH-hydrolase domains [Roseivivax lentus]|uniref:Peptidoglycan/LPS O-acetylase OafA/YrhL, contains acyltransferase and SGNH-hydrolase domains n=1 Tax=Roseivivax lentus TaxID=633194 RepID=A0A1N7P6M5_9RHOB|nr:acyltransferase [Roseivivax lentus]SIT06295.1 Peptidoglycan/LPS O-acetylase OafA/YrhL, contains acyltransferase and SGNH-hydrolase domains [Roseivivax lentus]